MDQLLGGMVDVKEKHTDGTVKYEVSKDFKPGRAPAQDESKATPESFEKKSYKHEDIRW